MQTRSLGPHLRAIRSSNSPKCRSINRLEPCWYYDAVPDTRSASASRALAERFWSLARAMDQGESADDPKHVVRHVLAILDALDTGQTGDDLSVSTVSFLALLHQSEAQGDLLYASPEQARGERMDERSLVFSIGVLIFEKLTGRHPFGADGNPRRLARIQKAEMASGVAYFQTISGPLRTILLRCMGPFPDERWRTIAELRVQLEAFVEDRSETRKSRTLPALPSEEDEVTRLFVQPASHKALSVAAEREVGRRQQSIGENRVAPVAAGTKPGLATKLSWMLAGAAVAALAALAIWLVGGRSDAADSEQVASVSKPAAPSAASEATPVPAAAPNSAALAPAPTKPPEAAIAKATSTATKSAAEAAPASVPSGAPAQAGAPQAPSVQAIANTVDRNADFDIEEGGRQALAALQSCFSAERIAGNMELGVSIYYPRAGVSKKIFFGGSNPKMRSDERSCIGTRLLGLTAGGAPKIPTTVSYSFFLKSEQSRVKAHLAKQ